MARPQSNSSDLDLSGYSCPNCECSLFGLSGQGNISFRAYYGKTEKRHLLYCRLCGQRFSATMGTTQYGSLLDPQTIGMIIRYAAEGVGTKATANLLNLNKQTVDQVIRRIALHCVKQLDIVLKSFSPVEVRLDEFLSFIKKNNIMRLSAQPEMETDLMPKKTRVKRIKSPKAEH